jgi:Family of unknown function (DUF6221)
MSIMLTMTAMTTPTLDEFLLGRIAEDEAHARLAGPCGCELPGLPLEHGYCCPARVLAECEAKRRIVELHSRCGTGIGYCDDGGHGWGDGGPLGCADLAYAALPFADHPDYLPEWGVT